MAEFFPDGTPIDSWFYETKVPSLEDLGPQYKITDHGILGDGRVSTQQLQSLIDRISAEGGGVMVIPAGTYMTGSIYLKQGVHLYLEAGATLKGSDDVADYGIGQTRIEGETCTYIHALINVENTDGTTICGPGTIDGNGLRAWKAFRYRRIWNPDCTNKDEQRARLIFFSGCTNVMVAGCNLVNSQFWTNHLYRCDHVKYLNCRIFSPREPVKAPSTDAIDLDVCTDVLIKNCYMEVNDDAVVLKGGKGPWADALPENGGNERILVEDCEYGFCHGCLTLGSESIHDRNVLVRRVKVGTGFNLLWLKMRPDTPQKYEYITMEDITGKAQNFLTILPWTQFFDLKGREDIPVSTAEHVTMRNCDFACHTFFNVEPDEKQMRISDLKLENLKVRAVVNGFTEEGIESVYCRDVEVVEDAQAYVSKHMGNAKVPD